ncbi:hypothetical protein ACUH94_07115 [Dermabacteraceae bacterium P7074]
MSVTPVEQIRLSRVPTAQDQISAAWVKTGNSLEIAIREAKARTAKK